MHVDFLRYSARAPHKLNLSLGGRLHYYRILTDSEY